MEEEEEEEEEEWPASKLLKPSYIRDRFPRHSMSLALEVAKYEWINPNPNTSSKAYF
jgi:hypothetical protein